MFIIFCLDQIDSVNIFLFILLIIKYISVTLNQTSCGRWQNQLIASVTLVGMFLLDRKK